MICERCGDIMELVDEYNPPYPEPCEKIYLCRNCGARALDSEAYGIEFYNL